MNYQDFHKLFTENPQAFNTSENLTAFLDVASLKEPYRDYLKKYTDDWANQFFHTCKSHGLGNAPWRALAMPYAKKATDIFAKVWLKETNTPRNGTFVSHHRAKGFALCGHFGGYFKHRELIDGEVITGHYGAKFYGTYCDLTEQAEALVVSMAFPWEWYLECVQWEDGRTLVIVRYGRIIGQTYLALLDGGESLTNMFNTDDKELAEATQKMRNDYEKQFERKDGRLYVK